MKITVDVYLPKSIESITLAAGSKAAKAVQPAVQARGAGDSPTASPAEAPAAIVTLDNKAVRWIEVAKESSSAVKKPVPRKLIGCLQVVRPCCDAAAP